MPNQTTTMLVVLLVCCCLSSIVAGALWGTNVLCDTNSAESQLVGMNCASVYESSGGSPAPSPATRSPAPAPGGSPAPAPGGSPAPAPGPAPAQQRVYANSGAASCTRYCGGESGAPWNNELPVAWGGATCVSAGKNNNLACSYVGADPATPGELDCVCQKSPSTPWSTGGFGAATGTGPGP
jgi:hypothetical protein